MKYKVQLCLTSTDVWANVDADSPEEAKEKAKAKTVHTIFYASDDDVQMDQFGATAINAKETAA